VTPERWAQIREIFDGALERPDTDRAAYLRITCAHDPELKREVDALLSSHAESSGFLTKSAVNVKSFFPSTEGAGDGSDYSAGYQLGPYVFERELGRGGMGSVWLAKRNDSDYSRRVAIKMVKRGMDSHEILRRFRMERQLLANLDHPNIATLLDGGSTPEGLPFLVMEYVEGTPIHKFCESHGCTVREKLEVFRVVCASVQYAHRNLVIHRDIKASNILVTPDGIPKLLDFGIAKLIRGPEGGPEAIQTRPDMRPMTLDYASPEQVRGENVTTATDVYSLGVLLYRLLVGKLPFRGDGSRATLERAICDEEPLRASLAVQEPDELAELPTSSTAIAQERKRLSKELAGDLDNIILMAMRKEAHRRYDSVEQFSEDIQRYLTGLPVIARLDTPGYQFAKFVRRNAEGVAAALVVGAALITIAAVSSHYADIAQAGGQEAERRNSIARHELAETTRALGETQEKLGDLTSAKASYERSVDVAQDLYEMEAARGGPAMDTLLILAESSERLSQRFLDEGDRQNTVKYLQIARKAYSEIVARNAKSLTPNEIATAAGGGIDATYAIARLDKKIAVVNSPPINEPPPQ
jgi:eukaryotic-like serine/threonine-protein kinase